MSTCDEGVHVVVFGKIECAKCGADVKDDYVDELSLSRARLKAMITELRELHEVEDDYCGECDDDVCNCEVSRIIDKYEEDA